MQLQTFDPRKQVHVKAGYFDESTKTYRRKVGPRHFMRIIGGYGIQEDIFKQLCQMQCERIVFETDEGEYESLMDTWMIKSRFPRNYGHGLQHFLAVEDMIKKF